MNYFELFGVDESFDIDSQKISQVYQTLQKTVHPDKFASASEQDRLLAVRKSSQINDAYQTLKSAVKRAEYLLTIRKVDMPSEQASFQDTTFLMRQMELREMLEDISSANDPNAAIFAANEALDQEHVSLLTLIQQQLRENSEQSNKLASENVRKLKFYQKLQIELDRIEDQLFDD